MTATLDFDAATHTYRLGGRVVPSVTEVIRAVLPGWQAAPWYLQRGQAMHRGCELADLGDLDWATVSPEIEPRIRAWGKFLAEAGLIAAVCEKRLASERYGFAGCLDRILTRLDTLATTKHDILCDLKSTLEPQVKLQLGAYSLLLPPELKCRRAVAVELRDDGTYRCLWLSQHELRRAEQGFLNVLGVFNWCRENKVEVRV